MRNLSNLLIQFGQLPKSLKSKCSGGLIENKVSILNTLLLLSVEFFAAFIVSFLSLSSRGSLTLCVHLSQLPVADAFLEVFLFNFFIKGLVYTLLQNWRRLPLSLESEVSPILTPCCGISKERAGDDVLIHNSLLNCQLPRTLRMRTLHIQTSYYYYIVHKQLTVLIYDFHL